MSQLSRRSILQLGSLSALQALTGRAWSTASPSAASRMMIPARYGDVAFTGGPLLEQFRAQHATLLAMDEDALLKPYREAAGLPAPGVDLGGWYNASTSFNPPNDMHGFIPGHSLGQYISSMARAYAVSGDVNTQHKVHRLVEGYAAAISPRFYDGYTLPAYTFDKVNVGLIDAHAFAADPVALKALHRNTDVALPFLPEKALTRPEMAARPHPNIAHTWDESYTLPENLYLAWARGAGDRYRTLARRFLLDREYFEPLARGENVLPDKHAYSHMNALSSALQAYLVDGNPTHLRAAQNGFDFVLAQSFATGGWGPNERFVVPGSGQLGDSIDSTHASFETPCGAYGHFKASRYLLSITGDGRYGDSMERVLYNTILGVLPMRPDGTSFYYSDYNSSGAKTYFEQRCPCCSGTMGQIVADYGISAYFTGERGIFVNLYAPSRFNWLQRGRPATLETSTAYPLDGAITMSLKLPASDRFSIALRIPAWAGQGTRVSINGKQWDQEVTAGHFLDVTRTWHDGDRIEMTMDMPLRLEAVDEKHKDLVALMQGPLALFAVGERFLPFTRAELLTAKQAGLKAGEWRATTADGTQVFKPFYALGLEASRLYQPTSA
jgi:DUF1680 family protein